MRKLLLLTAIAMLVAGVAMAKTDKDTGNRLGVDMTDINAMTAPGGLVTTYNEGFEGAFPPAGWTHGITNVDNTWEQQTFQPYAGVYSAYIRWDSVNPQDETLSFDYTIDVAADEYVLGFFMAGSIGQSWDLNATETVEVDGTTVFDFDSSVTVGYMEYDFYTVDLTAYDGQTVTITFRYAGLDGDAHYIDNVEIGDGSGPPPPPPVSFCDDVIDAEGIGTFTGDTCDGMNLISALGCEVYTENGLEDYYEVEVPAGASFTATVTGTYDGALWVVGECEAEGGAFTCLAYADDTFTGDPEVISYTNTSGSDEVVYLVVDAYGTDSCGTYEMLFESVDGAVANETMSMGDVKSLFR